MKRVAEWAVYAVGALAIAYLAFYAYTFFTRPQLRPGEPIRIFRKQDAPRYSLDDTKNPARGGSRRIRSQDGRGVTPSPRKRDGRCCRPA